MSLRAIVRGLPIMGWARRGVPPSLTQTVLAQAPLSELARDCASRPMLRAAELDGKGGRPSAFRNWCRARHQRVETSYSCNEMWAWQTRDEALWLLCGPGEDIQQQIRGELRWELARGELGRVPLGVEFRSPQYRSTGTVPSASAQGVLGEDCLSKTRGTRLSVQPGNRRRRRPGRDRDGELSARVAGAVDRATRVS